jgi:transcriptional regulator with XRE-family HTH domain
VSGPIRNPCGGFGDDGLDANAIDRRCWLTSEFVANPSRRRPRRHDHVVAEAAALRVAACRAKRSSGPPARSRRSRPGDRLQRWSPRIHRRAGDDGSGLDRALIAAISSGHAEVSQRSGRVDPPAARAPGPFHAPVRRDGRHSNPYLSQIERGLRAPSEHVLNAIAGSLQTSADALREQAGVPRQPEGISLVIEAIRSDARLTAAQRQALLEVYRSFTE